jgi:Spy/CpxP family protein refolding chaperone
MRQIITTALLLLFVGTLTVQAQNKNQREKRMEVKERFEKRTSQKVRYQKGSEVMLRMMNLDEDQKEQVKAIMLDGKKELIPFENQLGEKRARLRTLSSGDSYDVNALNKVVDEMADLQASIKKIHIAKRGEIRSLLNDEQKVIFDSMPDRGERMKHRARVKKLK